MALRDILWDTEEFSPNDYPWFIEGTAYNEDGLLVSVKHRIPDRVRQEAVKAGGIVSYRALFQFKEEDLIRSDGLITRSGPTGAGRRTSRTR